jgi:hypothetical protein
VSPGILAGSSSATLTVSTSSNGVSARFGGSGPSRISGNGGTVLTQILSTPTYGPLHLTNSGASLMQLTVFVIRVLDPRDGLR